jgi:antitoxin VapB
MPLNIKNTMVEELVAELARLTGETKTEAVRRALAERLERVRRRTSGVDRAERLRRVLESEIWPTVPTDVRGRPRDRDDEERILGLDDLP